MEDGEVCVRQGTFAGCFGCGQCMMACPTGSIAVTGRRLKPEHVIELPPPERRASADHLDPLLLSRRSIRRFQDQEVGRELVERIVEMACTAPMGAPPSEVGITILHGRAKVRAFSEDMLRAFEKSIPILNPAVLRLLRPLMRKAERKLIRDFVRPVMQLDVAKWKNGVDKLCYRAPLAMIFHRTPLADDADAHIVTTYAMLAAESLGLGSCWIGMSVALNHYKDLKEKYRVPQNSEVSGMLVIGYPAIQFQRTLRRQLASVEFV
jgi:nitroreductase